MYAGRHDLATTRSTTVISELIQKTAISKGTKNMWMEGSTRESRLSTSSRPSSGARRERNISPRSLHRNESQYSTRAGAPRGLVRLFTKIKFDMVVSKK